MGHPCAEFWGIGFGALNDDILPPASEPEAQCFFTMYDVHPGVISHRLDDLVMCKRWQLAAEPPAQFRLFYFEGMSRRECGGCGYIQFKASRNHGTFPPQDRETFGLKARLRTCDGCHVVHYCNPACQLRDWQNHKSACKATRRQNRRSRAGPA